MFTVKNDPSYLWIALVLLATGAVFQEFAVVSYNAMLPQVSTPRPIGRVSGFGWAMGYFGGIFLLLICYVGFIAPDVGWFGVTSAGGLNIRAVVVFSAIWFAVFAIPVLMAVPESPPGPKRRRVGFFASYRLLVNDIKALFKRDRNSVYFLIASALYRDGLAAIFSFRRDSRGERLRTGAVNRADLRNRRQRRRRAGSTRAWAPSRTGLVRRR